jgi:hypothetical protein
MPDSASSPDERARASDAAGRALIGLARDCGAEFITREAYRGSDRTVRDPEPLAGPAPRGTSSSVPGAPPASTSVRRARPGTAWIR